MSARAQTLQLFGSLLAAAVIVAIAIVVVTAQFGPTSAAEQEAREERLDQRIELQEERAKQREEAREERLEREEDGRGGSGPG